MTNEEKLDFIKKHYLSSRDQLLLLYKNKSIEDSQTLNNNYIPEYLYKYRTCTDKNINALKEGKACFTNPNTWNDEIDVTVIYDLNRDSRYLEKIYNEYIVVAFFHLINRYLDSAKKPPMSNDDFLEFFKSINRKEKLNKSKTIQYLKPHLGKKQAKLAVKELKNILLKTHKIEFKLEIRNKFESFCKFNNIRDNFLMYCLSETYDNQSQWSMYTDEGKGFCIGYNIHKLNNIKLLNSLLPIYYGTKKDLDGFKIVDEFLYFLVNGKFQSNLKNSEIQNLYASLYTKDPTYNGEQEWRFCFGKTKKEDGEETKNWEYVEFHCAESIYLGQNIEDERKNKLIEIAKQQNLKVYQRKRINKSKWKYKEIVLK